MFTNDINLIKLLLKNGANPNIKNSFGEKPIDYAQNEEIISVIICILNSYYYLCINIKII